MSEVVVKRTASELFDFHQKMGGDAFVCVGSGQRPFGTNWVNCDINPKWKPDIEADGAALDLPNDSCETICLHHVLEHFGCGEAKPLIENCYRMLKPGGSLLVFVPDPWALAQGWFKGRISEQVYMTNMYGAYMDDEADRHKWQYSASALRAFLKSCAPWREVKQFDGRDIEGASIAQDWWILGYEVIK